MSKLHNRRGFLNFAGAGAGLLGASSWTKAWAAETPDLIVTNATVYTVDSAMPRAEAFAVRDGKFVRVVPPQPGTFDCDDNKPLPTLVIDPFKEYKG